MTGNLHAAIEQLTNYQEQCDADGIMVKVSRQALEMVLKSLRSPAQRGPRCGDCGGYGALDSGAVCLECSGAGHVAAAQPQPSGEPVISSVQISQLDDASNACLELASKHGFATGHGDTVADMIREFSAQIRAPEAGEAKPVAWRDIATAPKDGTFVDLLHRSGHRYSDTWWDEEDEVWVCIDQGDDAFTHWMPIPTPPSAHAAPVSADAGLSAEDVNRIRQWFNATDDCAPKYLEKADRDLMARLLSQRPAAEADKRDIS